jgi:hypothetical protein
MVDDSIKSSADNSSVLTIDRIGKKKSYDEKKGPIHDRMSFIEGRFLQEVHNTTLWVGA